jgi:phage terminase small subunit
MRKDNMNKLTIDDLEQDQQEILDKSDIKTLSHYCLQLQNYQDQIDNLEQDLKSVKEQADKISSEIIPNLLAEQGLSSLKLADGSAVEVKKSYSCTVKKDAIESAYTWLRENGLGDIIKNEVAVQFGKGEDNKAQELLDLAVREGYEPSQKQKVEPMTLKALYRERVEAGLDMPSDSFNIFVKDQTKISRK